MNEKTNVADFACLQMTHHHFFCKCKLFSNRKINCRLKETVRLRVLAGSWLSHFLFIVERIIGGAAHHLRPSDSPPPPNLPPVRRGVVRALLGELIIALKRTTDLAQ